MSIGFYGGKFLPPHMGHLNCILQASGMCDKLYIGISYSKSRELELTNISKIKSISPQQRKEWLEQLTNYLDNIEVFIFEDSDIKYQSWWDGAKQVREVIGDKIDYVYGSEPLYEGVFNRLYPEAQYVIIDPDRGMFNVSATDIRTDGVFKYWDMIPNICKPYFNKKVVITGTESCGKSTLVRKLAEYYNTKYVEEYGRTMCEQLGTGQPLSNHYPYIAYGHKIEEFKQNMNANKVLIIDTDAVVTQYYNELYNNQHSDVIDAIITANKYDLWINLEPDVNWIDDGLRIHGDVKQRNDNNLKLKEMLNKYQIKYVSVSGDYNTRFLKSIEYINELIQ